MKMNYWLWLLNEFRYQTMHRSFIRRHIAAGSNAAKVSFIYKKKSKVKVGKIIQEIEEEKIEQVIPYLQSLVRMKNMIDNIRSREPALQ